MKFDIFRNSVAVVDIYFNQKLLRKNDGVGASDVYLTNWEHLQHQKPD